MKLLIDCGVKTVGLAVLLVVSLTEVSAQNAPALIWSKVQGGWSDNVGNSFDAIAVNPANTNIIFIGSASGAGIFKSTDGGSTWVAKNSGVPLAGNFPVISKIIISPSNTNIIYFGTANDNAGDIFKSMDGGESWQRFSGQQNFLGVYQLNGAVYDFDVSPTDPNTVYAGVTGQGLMKTTDGGNDWAVVYAAGNNTDDARDYINVVRIVPTSPETLFFSGFTYVTADSIPVPTPDLDTAGTIGCSPFPLRKSTDGGSTWSISPVSWPTILDVPLAGMITDLQYEKADGSLFFSTIAYQTPFYVSIGNKGIYKSSDLGGSWQTVNQASFGSLDQIPFVAMSANQSSVNKGIFASTGFGGIVVASTNAGNNWMQLDPCLSSAFIAKTALAGNRLFALTDLGIYFADISSLYALPAPAISFVTPANLSASVSPQLITINGSNFLPSTDPNASFLVFYDPSNNSYTRTPSNVTSTSMQYNIAVGSATGTWKVKVVNGSVESPLYTFSVAPVNTQLQGLSISGPANIFQNTSGNQYVATALFSDGSTATVTPMWSLNSGAPASISSSGSLTASGVSVNTAITITASYTYNGVTRSANYGVKISPAGSCGSYVTNIISNGDFESGSTGWTLSGGAIISTYGSLYHSATHYLWLGGDNGTDSAYYQTAVSSSATSATLSLYENINTSEPTSLGAYDTLSIVIRDTSGNLLGTVASWSNLNGTTAGSYQYQTFNLLPYAGKTIRIYFVSSCHLSGSQTTNFRIDDVGIIAAIPNPVTAVLFGMNGPTSVSQNTTAQYNAIVVNCDNSIQSVTPSWSISSGPATISFSGQLSAGSVSADTSATVTAIYGSARIDYPITIIHVAPVFTSLVIGGVSSVFENQPAQFTATELFSDGSGQSVAPTWSVDSSAASISSSGLLTAGTVNANTTVTVSASYTAGGITHTASQQVTIIYVPPPPSLTALSIFGANSVNENNSAQFSAAALFSDGSSLAVNPIWNVDISIADISPGGLFSVGDKVLTNTVAMVSASYFTGGITCSASNSVAVIFVAPVISFQTINNQFILSWPTNYSDFSLECTTNFQTMFWTPSLVLPVVVGQQFFVTNPITAGSVFYRLVQ